MTYDLSELTPHERSEKIQAEFEMLEPGQGFTVISPEKEQATLAYLQTHYPSAVEWHNLEEGPDVYCMVVAKKAPTPSRRRQVMEYMEQDHAWIHSQLDQLRGAALEEDSPKIAQLIRQLKTGLSRHILKEETYLLPLIEERLGGQQKMVVTLKTEHLQLMEILDRLIASVEGEGHPADAVRQELLLQVKGLQSLLENHSGMEERILYAVTDLLCSAEERDQLVRRCQAL